MNFFDIMMLKGVYLELDEFLGFSNWTRCTNGLCESNFETKFE